MIYVFSASVNNKAFWYKDVNDLPIMNGVNIEYHIYPVYEVGGKLTNLLREKIFLKDGQFSSHYFHFPKYLAQTEADDMRKANLTSLFICGTGEFTTVFLNDEAYIHYSLITKTCYRVNL